MGLPKYFLVDQHDATMCALDSAELDYKDLQLQLLRQFGIIFDHCPVGGHDVHLSVEYRCVRCWECWACKNADETEKISLREKQCRELAVQADEILPHGWVGV